MRQLLALFLAVAACDVPAAQVTPPPADPAPMSVDDGASTRIERVSSAATSYSTFHITFGENFTLPWDTGLAGGVYMDDMGNSTGNVVPPIASWVCQKIDMQIYYSGADPWHPGPFISEQTIYPTAVTVGAQGNCANKALKRCEYKFTAVTVPSGSSLVAWISPMTPTGQGLYAQDQPKTFTLPAASGGYVGYWDRAGPYLDKPWWRHFICGNGYACGNEWYADGSINETFKRCTPVEGVCRQPCSLETVTW